MIELAGKNDCIPQDHFQALSLCEELRLNKWVRETGRSPSRAPSPCVRDPWGATMVTPRNGTETPQGVVHLMLHRLEVLVGRGWVTLRQQMTTAGSTTVLRRILLGL